MSLDCVKLRADNVNTLYYDICKTLMSDKSRRVDLAGNVKTRELIGFTAVLDNPYSRIVTLRKRDISMKYLVGEYCFYLAGSRELAFINKYSKFWNKVSDDGFAVNSAYGYTIFKKKVINEGKEYSQFEYVFDCLGEDKHSRKAVIYVSGDYNAYKSKDNICTSTLQFLIRDNKLYLITNMRSNDVWFGFTYDIAFFTLLQEIMLVKLRMVYPDLQMGEYIHHTGSMHVYKKNYEELKALVADGLEKVTTTTPRLQIDDINYWFKNLLDYEEVLRLEHVKLELSTTPFQRYCINILEE